MKMAYERPMMRAEMFQANSFVAACGDVTGFVDPNRESLQLKEASRWFELGAGDSQTLITDESTKNSLVSQFGDLKFEKDTLAWDESQSSNANGELFYYWSATSGTDKYWLEYSVGRTNYNKKDSFVLYKEKYDSSKLNIMWDGYLRAWSDNIWPWADDSLYGVYFDTRIVQKS